MMRNRGSEAAALAFVHDGVEAYVDVNPGAVYYLPYKVNYGEKVSEVYTSLAVTFPTSGRTVTYDVNQKVTEQTLMIFEFTDAISSVGESIITMHTENGVTLEYNYLGNVTTINMDPNGSYDLPEPITNGNTLNSVYSDIEATQDERVVYMANLMTVINDDTTLDIVPETYWKVTLDMNGNSVTDATTGDPITFSSTMWVRSGVGLGDAIGTAVYVQRNTYVPDTPAHADAGQIGIYNGCTYDNGAARYPFPEAPTEDVDLVCHTTYEYMTDFSCDCYDASVGYPGWAGITDKSGEYVQYRWSDIVTALQEVYPNRELVAVWTDDQKTTQVSFSETTVDYTEGLWSEPVVPAALSNVNLYLETREIE